MSRTIVGHIVAVASGVAYLLPMTETFEKIQSAMKCEYIKLPSPFVLLANLARRCHESQDEGASGGAARYAAEALSDSVLDWDQDPTAKKLRRITKIDKDSRLSSLIEITGADVAKALASPQVWSELTDEHMHLSSILGPLCAVFGISPTQIHGRNPPLQDHRSTSTTLVGHNSSSRVMSSSTTAPRHVSHDSSRSSSVAISVDPQEPNYLRRSQSEIFTTWKPWVFTRLVHLNAFQNERIDVRISTSCPTFV